MTDSVGARLRQARELRRLSLQQVSEITKLRIHYLQALEDDDYSAIPSAAQARGFLRLYAEFLELDFADLVSPAQPVAAPAAATGAVAPAVPSTRPGLWATLRERLGRRPRPEPSAAAAEPPAIADVPKAPVEAAEPAPASSDVKTKTSPRSKIPSADVKKNAAS